MTVVEVILIGLALVAVGISFVTDLRTRKILNVVTLPAIVLGLTVHLIAGGWSGEGFGLFDLPAEPDALRQIGLKSSLIGLVGGGLPFLLLTAMDDRAFGMGDVKLMAAVGALLGWPFILHDVLYVALSGGVLALIVLLWKGRTLKTLGGMVSRGKRKGGEGGPDTDESDESGGRSQKIYVPYGVAIAAGTIWAILADLLEVGTF